MLSRDLDADLSAPENTDEAQADKSDAEAGRAEVGMVKPDCGIRAVPRCDEKRRCRRLPSSDTLDTAAGSGRSELPAQAVVIITVGVALVATV